MKLEIEPGARRSVHEMIGVLSEQDRAFLAARARKNLEASTWRSASVLAEHLGVEGLPQAPPDGFVEAVLRCMSQWSSEFAAYLSRLLLYPRRIQLSRRRRG